VLQGVDAISECGVMRGKYPAFTSQIFAVRKMDFLDVSSIESSVALVSICKENFQLN